MSLMHEFLVRPRAIVGRDYWPTGDPDKLVIHDEVLDLLWHTLEFIPSYNPSRSCEPQHGLNRWGVTKIEGEGAAIAARVFRAWADLYALGPPQLRIKGPAFSTVGDEEEPDGEGSQIRLFDEELPEDELSEAEAEDEDEWRPYGIGVGVADHVVTDDRGNGYVHYDIDRDALVALLRQLAEWCDRVAADHELCLLHLGI